MKWLHAYRLLLIAFVLIQIILFIGLWITGIIELTSIRIPMDYFTAGLYLFLSTVILLVLKVELKKLLSPNWSNTLSENLAKNYWPLIISIGLFIVIYLLRFQLSGLFIFIGHEIGSFFIRATRPAFQLINFNITSSPFIHVAWLFQLYYLVIITTLIRSILKFFKKKLHL